MMPCSVIRKGLLALVCGPLLALICLVLMSGCKSDSAGGRHLSWKNPFSGRNASEKEESPAPPRAELADAAPGEPSREVAEHGSRPGPKKKSADEFSRSYDQELLEARNLERVGKLNEARGMYERLLGREPERYEAYHRLAVVSDRQRRYREAQALYSQAVRLQPQASDLWNDLGYCLFLQGRLDQSERALLKAVALSPSNARYRNNLGMVYGHEGRYEEALDQFRRGGSEADAYYNLAFVLASKSDDEGAKNCFHLALAVDPTYDRARQALQRFEEAEKDPQGVLDNSTIVENGIRWEPYVEGSETQKSENEVQTTSLVTPAASGRIVPSTRPSTQAELRRARTGWTEDVQASGEP